MYVPIITIKSSTNYRNFLEKGVLFLICTNVPYGLAAALTTEEGNFLLPADIKENT